MTPAVTQVQTMMRYLMSADAGGYEKLVGTNLERTHLRIYRDEESLGGEIERDERVERVWGEEMVERHRDRKRERKVLSRFSSVTELGGIRESQGAHHGHRVIIVATLSVQAQHLHRTNRS